MGLKLLALRRAAAAAKCGAACGGVAVRLSGLSCNASRLEKLTHKLMMAF